FCPAKSLALLRLMVLPALKTIGSKVIVSAPKLVLALMIACRRLPGPVSAVGVTGKVAGTARASRDSRSRGALPGRLALGRRNRLETLATRRAWGIEEGGSPRVSTHQREGPF